MCIFQENCKYSIKKILTYIFTLLAIYIVVFTDKEVYDILLFIAALLGIRGYERVKLWDKDDIPPNPSSEDGLNDNSVLGKKRKRRLLTD